MKLLVIRHGESEADIKKVCEGRADFELTDKGTQQARVLASWINENYRVSRIYTSPLSRAKATAQFVALETKIPVTPLADLMEFNNGQLAGVPFSQVAQKFPVVPNVPPYEAVYGQETKLEFRLRAEPFRVAAFLPHWSGDG